MRIKYPKRLSRAKRKKLRAQKGFAFTIMDMANFYNYFQSAEAKSRGWVIIGGNLIP